MRKLMETLKRMMQVAGLIAEPMTGMELFTAMLEAKHPTKNMRKIF